MKLVEKKCPKCGAPLSFDENAEETVCEYCKSKVSINRKNNVSTSEDFILSIEEFYKERYKQKESLKLSKFICCLIMLVVCGFILWKLSNSANETSLNSKTDIPVKEKIYVTEISQIDENTLNDCHSKALEKLNNKDNSSKTEWKHAGIYLLNHKETKQFNLFYDVYKKEYKSASGVMTLYAAVEFNNLELSENGTLDNYRVGSVYYPCSWINNENICGYNTSEDFFNKVIRNQTNKYKVTSTAGVYLEKIGN